MFEFLGNIANEIGAEIELRFGSCNTSKISDEDHISLWHGPVKLTDEDTIILDILKGFGYDVLTAYNFIKHGDTISRVSKKEITVNEAMKISGISKQDIEEGVIALDKFKAYMEEHYQKRIIDDNE